MSTSASRTIVAPVSRSPLSRPPLGWPLAQPGDDLDYSFDMSLRLADVGGDVIATASLAIKPSGDGELQIVGITVNGPVVTAQLTGGVSGRGYECEIKVGGLSGRTWEDIIPLTIDPVLAIFPLVSAPSSDFGTPLAWTSGAVVFGPALLPVANNLTATGTNQATALLLGAQTNILTDVPSGTGVRLAALLNGTQVLTNDTDTEVFAYPPPGAEIESLGDNLPAIVSPHQTVSFSTGDGQQWSAT